MAQEGSSDQRHSRLPVQSPGPGSGTALEGSFVKLVFVTAVTGRDAVFSRCFRECPSSVGARVQVRAWRSPASTRTEQTAEERLQPLERGGPAAGMRDRVG